MTPEEQQQVQVQLDAGMAHMEKQCGNLAREGAQQAMIVAAERQAHAKTKEALAAAEKRIAELTPKPKQKAVE